MSLVSGGPLDSVQSLANTTDRRADEDSTCLCIKATFNLADTEDK